MIRNLLLCGIFAVCLLFLFIPAFPQHNSPSATASSSDLVKRGEYLTIIGGCHDCHTPKKMGAKGPEPDFSKALSGHPATEKIPEIPKAALAPGQWLAVTNNHLTAWAGPWGVSFAFNLTPDEETGMGT
jgi:mono/diheme cytochrome c family protein